MNLSKKQKYVAVGSAAIILAAGSGAAYAYWTNSGSGTGSATTDTNQSVTVNQTGGSTVKLYPGGPAQTLSGNFDNPNPGKVYVAQVTIAVTDGWSAQAVASKPACTSADFSITQPDPTNAEIASGTGVGGWSGGSIALVDSNANQDNCKGVTVPLTYSSN